MQKTQTAPKRTAPAPPSPTQTFRTWIDLLRVRATDQPSQVGYVFLADGDQQEVPITYAELDRNARAIAVALQKANATGGRALLLYPPGLEFISALFGCWYAGVTAVPAYPPRSAQHASAIATLQSIAEDCVPEVILTSTKMRQMVEGSRAATPALACAEVLATDDLNSTSADAWTQPHIDTNTLALLQYTSGSTGAPRGVMLNHRHLLTNSLAIREAFSNTTESRGVGWLPPYHDMGLIGGILQPIFVGFPVYLMAPAAFLQRPARWLNAVSRYRATCSGGPNFAYELCSKAITDEDLSQLDLSNWQVAFNGAEPVNPQTLERFAARFSASGFKSSAFYPCYGLAESTLLVSGGDVGGGLTIQTVSADALEKNQVALPTSPDDAMPLVACGRPRPTLDTLRIVDPQTLNVCPHDGVGEIWIRSASVAQGYWRKPDESRTTFEAYIADPAEGPFLRTGDLGFIHDGELFVTGRLKDLIIIRGLNHYPQDIEQTVQNCHPAPSVGGGAAFSVSSADGERLVIVQEIERTQRDGDLAAVVDTIRHAVAERHELQVAAIMLLKPAQIPKTSSGKIRRRACRAAFLDKKLEPLHAWTAPAIEPAPAPTPTPTPDPFHPAVARHLSAFDLETIITNRLAAALNVAPSEIDPGEPFARYGLDSAGAMALAGNLETELGLPLPATLFYDFPTVTDLATHLSNASKPMTTTP